MLKCRTYIVIANSPASNALVAKKKSDYTDDEDDVKRDVDVGVENGRIHDLWDCS